MTQLKRMFRTTALAAFAAVLVGLVSGEAMAGQAGSWTLENQSGQVHLAKPGIAPISLSTGDVFADGDWIETGPDGRAMLRRGEETIVVAPNSRIGLPKNNKGPYATRILQTLGTILLTVEKKAAQHFQVETPYLTAVVKGTTFTVGIQDGRSVVHVVEGLVEVKNLSSGRSSLVRPGQTGSVVPGGGGDVDIGGGDVKGAPASAAATQAQGAVQATAQAASQVSPAAVTARSKGGSGKVRILQALGPTSLDLGQSTKGLVRAARGGDGNAPGKGLATGRGAAANGDLKAGNKAGSNGLALGRNAPASAALSNTGSNGLALGKGATASAVRSSAGSGGLALGHNAGTSADLSSVGSNGLALGQSVGASAASSRPGNNGPALGNSVSAGLQVPGNNGLGADGNPHANPNANQGNGKSNGKGKAK